MFVENKTAVGESVGIYKMESCINPGWWTLLVIHSQLHHCFFPFVWHNQSVSSNSKQQRHHQRHGKLQPSTHPSRKLFLLGTKFLLQIPVPPWQLIRLPGKHPRPLYCNFMPILESFQDDPFELGSTMFDFLCTQWYSYSNSCINKSAVNCLHSVSDPHVLKLLYCPSLCQPPQGSELPGEAEIYPWAKQVGWRWDPGPPSTGSFCHSHTPPATLYPGDQEQDSSFPNQTQAGLYTFGCWHKVALIKKQKQLQIGPTNVVEMVQT